MSTNLISCILPSIFHIIKKFLYLSEFFSKTEPTIPGQNILKENKKNSVLPAVKAYLRPLK